MKFIFLTHRWFFWFPTVLGDSGLHAVFLIWLFSLSVSVCVSVAHQSKGDWLQDRRSFRTQLVPRVEDQGAQQCPYGHAWDRWHGRPGARVGRVIASFEQTCGPALFA